MRHHYRIHLATLGILLIITLGLSACYPRTAPTTPAPAPPTPTPPSISANNIDISGFAFVPDTLAVSAGTTVTWTNADSVSHTISSRDGAFESGFLAKGDSFSYTFEQTGTFDYYCGIHPFMTDGKVIVEE